MRLAECPVDRHGSLAQSVLVFTAWIGLIAIERQRAIETRISHYEFGIDDATDVDRFGLKLSYLHPLLRVPVREFHILGQASLSWLFPVYRHVHIAFHVGQPAIDGIHVEFQFLDIEFSQAGDHIVIGDSRGELDHLDRLGHVFMLPIYPIAIERSEILHRDQISRLGVAGQLRHFWSALAVWFRPEA